MQKKSFNLVNILWDPPIEIKERRLELILSQTLMMTSKRLFA